MSNTRPNRLKTEPYSITSITLNLKDNAALTTANTILTHPHVQTTHLTYEAQQKFNQNAAVA